MKAYLQQYSLYPPFIHRKNHTQAKLYLAIRFHSYESYLRCLFRWSKVIDGRIPIVLIALWNEDSIGTEDGPASVKAMYTDTNKILKDCRQLLKVSFVFHGVNTSNISAVHDLKLIGDEVCYQLLKRRKKLGLFFYTKSFMIPKKGILEQLIRISNRKGVYVEALNLPSPCFEFSPEDIKQVTDGNNWQDWLNSVESYSVLFKTNYFIESFGKEPSQEGLSNLIMDAGNRLQDQLIVDIQYISHINKKTSSILT